MKNISPSFLIFIFSCLGIYIGSTSKTNTTILFSLIPITIALYLISKKTVFLLFCLTVSFALYSFESNEEDFDRFVGVVNSKSYYGIVVKTRYIIKKEKWLEKSLSVFTIVNPEEVNIKTFVVGDTVAGFCKNTKMSFMENYDFICRASAVFKVEMDKISGFAHFAAVLRNKIKESISEYDDSGIIAGVVLGDYTEIPFNMRSKLSLFGTIHILAISGLHFGMVAAIGFFLSGLLIKMKPFVNLLHILEPYLFRSLLSILLQTFYLVISGYTQSGVRAYSMSSLITLSIAFGRPKKILDILFSAGFIILLLSPKSLYSISFQLSFLATMMIVSFPPKTKKWIKESLYISLLSSAGVVPVLCANSLPVSYISPIANLFYIPAFFPIVLFGVLAALFSIVFQPLGEFFFYIAEKFCHIVIYMTNFDFLEPLTRLSVWNAIVFPKTLKLPFIFLFSSITYLLTRKRRWFVTLPFLLPILLNFLYTEKVLMRRGIFLFSKDDEVFISGKIKEGDMEFILKNVHNKKCVSFESIESMRLAEKYIPTSEHIFSQNCGKIIGYVGNLFGMWREE